MRSRKSSKDIERISHELKKYIVENTIKRIHQKYTPEGKIAYDDKTRNQTLKLYYSGISGRDV